ncbi:nitroreductase family protein [Sphingomonas sp. 35-24ZXX]|uniref:nitroreductase family protein n=1 Tax=Sphingomonas sp. 35-24ZXX TaxID=1545915 RepID=UPI00053BF6F3|nr:nitroreductase [Sphingomonas sp. 35-24ZXX]
MTEFNDLSSLTRYLATRRSGSPRAMIAPGPDAAQIREIVATALRTPDHGKLNPWRVVHVAGDQRDALAQGLTQAYRAEKPGAGRLEIEAMETFARHAPEMLVVLFCPRESSKIPLWEQQLSAGAFVMNLLHAAHARGFVGGWITGWPSYSDMVRNLFGSAPEQIAGFVYMGTAGQPQEERPRPEFDAVFSEWQPSLR